MRQVIRSLFLSPFKESCNIHTNISQSEHFLVKVEMASDLFVMLY